ncbi:GNAT family N-acetyltransferase [Legionella israelensis]|uniref:N-acetyltransferase GCN5 n=1 Tax=Legionella israelensis TaxID=454 RepID=A0A0W0VHA9_9GAMM|nr:GNAT family N-acetyltransferase [Legionella israelensis]KTD19419.1 N-acetyltransferase GCN5 [Legionella israelensis]QBS10354.1 GNAT family N-acetyltransferase [Legionella israelensis]SCY42902.1 Acetyltransferase (GNAT) domain-containing protein [Legionella israelensis DSM 19235]STX59955.1 N-acetyltransferase GCN5 [Legionella israelensis]
MKNKIEFINQPAPSDVELLTKKINEETAEFGEAHPFAFLIRDNEKHIIAGANGFVIYGTVYTDQLWVDPKYRNQGLAKQIMDKVHEFGRLEGCKVATIQTMSFQNAVRFYKNLGYVPDFKRYGYVDNSYCIFMRKELD